MPNNFVPVAATGLPKDNGPRVFAAAVLGHTADPTIDPIFTTLDEHKRARALFNDYPGNEDDPEFEGLAVEEEALLQNLGNLRPATLAGAVALLAHMAECEGCFTYLNSPFLRTVNSVVAALSGMREASNV
jgi:hypothetical protein